MNIFKEENIKKYFGEKYFIFLKEANESDINNNDNDTNKDSIYKNQTKSSYDKFKEDIHNKSKSG